MIFSYLSVVCCRHCNKLLSNSEDHLVLHSKTCASVDRPDQRSLFVCCICDYVTRVRTHMREHIRSRHTKEKPFDCEHCSRNFSRLRDLKLHVLKVHPDDGWLRFRTSQLNMARDHHPGEWRKIDILSLFCHHHSATAEAGTTIIKMYPDNTKKTSKKVCNVVHLFSYKNM
jgi:hypothetical protein